MVLDFPSRALRYHVVDSTDSASSNVLRSQVFREVKYNFLWVCPFCKLVLDGGFNVFVCRDILQLPLHLFIVSTVEMVSPILLLDGFVAFFFALPIFPNKVVGIPSQSWSLSLG